MACSYYQFRQNDYYCNKKGDYVNSDVYNRYCKNYDYDDCPIYKNESNGGCFITSACVGVLGCADDGEELTLLRKFRDTYMRRDCVRCGELREYYEIAPNIVNKINNQNNFYEIYKTIYNEMIAPCIAAIKDSMTDEAYEIYKREYQKLKKKYYE